MRTQNIQHSSHARRIWRNQNGSVAVLFALTVVLLICIVGAAIDGARALSARDSLQQDIDSTLLFVGTRMARGEEAADVKQDAQKYIDGLARQRHTTGSSRILDLQHSSGTIRATAEATVAMTMTKLMGFDAIKVHAGAEVQIAQNPTDISLVLDVTGSMSGSKIESLKTAATNLINSVYNAPGAENLVRVSVVPFARYVNVGLQHRNDSWMSVPPDSTRTENQCYNTYPNATTSNCRTETSTAYNDGTPYTVSSQVCDWDYGEAVVQCTDQQFTETWHGCAGSRSHPLNVRDGSYSTRIPGVTNVSCGQPLTPLTTDKDVAADAINSLTAAGETYIPSGLIWGWRALSPGAPFEESAVQLGGSGQDSRKIMVLMTDGANTYAKNVGDAKHDLRDPAAANDITRELCTNIKDAKITVFTVAFEVGDAAIKEILRNCASSPSYYFDASGSEQLLDAFEKIAAKFSGLHLTR